jgi:hypothetical protein
VAPRAASTAPDNPATVRPPQEEIRMEEPEQERKGKVDLVTVLYVVFGVPLLVGFMVLLFGLVNFFPSIPA